MYKDEIIDKAVDLFLENGAKTVTMDDIAKELGMSKKTLYQKYENKEALLEEVLRVGLEGVIETMKYQNQEVHNAIDRMLARDKTIEKACRTNDSIFLRQLVRYYPQIFNKHMLNFYERFSQIIIHNIERGREQGLYRKDFDPSQYARLYFQLVMTYDNSPFLDTAELPRFQYYDQALYFFLHAITSEQGKRYLDGLQGSST